MPALSDRLKALGVKVGLNNLPAPQVAAPQQATSRAHPILPIEEVAPGRLVETDAGFVFVVEQTFPVGSLHGAQELALTASLQILSRWAGEPSVAHIHKQELAFLDTETSGLAGGAGTFAFLIGVGRFEGESFRLAQFFMRDPGEEPALLLALESFLAPINTLVSFNGKAFDVPLLNTRYTLQGWRSPLPGMAQLDLLHLARRLWRDRLPSRTLGSLEVEILDIHRTSEEVPGWMIPQMYFDYLRSGDASEMKKVFYHNSMDVLSLAALLNHQAHMLEDPFQMTADQSLDQVALARLFEDLGNYDLAESLYQNSLEQGMPDEFYWDALQRLSFLHKQHRQFDRAIALWEKAAGNRLIYAHVELAKYYEHTQRDIAQALHWTQAALEIVSAPSLFQERLTWLEELEHRQQRLQHKLAFEHK